MHEHGSKAGVASDANEYQQAALRTEADQAAVLDRLHKAGPKLMRLLDGAVGLSADAGEVLGLVQKAVEYGRPVDPVKLKEELGDVLWRVAQTCAAAGLTMSEVMRGNLGKLWARYGDRYTDAAANARDEAAERRALEQDGHGFGHEVLEGEAD